jgi:hypothetical protein
VMVFTGEPTMRRAAAVRRRLIRAGLLKPQTREDMEV